jgi:hypothetical protein
MVLLYSLRYQNTILNPSTSLFRLYTRKTLWKVHLTHGAYWKISFLITILFHVFRRHLLRAGCLIHRCITRTYRFDFGCNFICFDIFTLPCKWAGYARDVYFAMVEVFFQWGYTVVCSRSDLLWRPLVL